MIQYRPIRMIHPIAGYSYGIVGEEYGKDGISRRSVMIPDVSCDYMFVSRLAVKCTVGQLDPEQILDVIYDSLP